jgi:hypothetical protein
VREQHNLFTSAGPRGGAWPVRVRSEIGKVKVYWSAEEAAVLADCGFWPVVPGCGSELSVLFFVCITAVLTPDLRSTKGT